MLNVTASNFHTKRLCDYCETFKSFNKSSLCVRFHSLRKNLRNRKIRLSRKAIFISFLGRNASNFERPLSKKLETASENVDGHNFTRISWILPRIPSCRLGRQTFFEFYLNSSLARRHFPSMSNWVFYFAIFFFFFFHDFRFKNWPNHWTNLPSFCETVRAPPECMCFRVSFSSKLEEI